MAYEIILKKRFTNKTIKLLYYLEPEWGKKVSEEFLIKLRRRLNTLSKQPYIGSPSAKIKGVRGILITKYNKVFYKVSANKVIVLNMYDTRINREKIPVKLINIVNIETYKKLSEECASKNVTLVAVSKTKPAEDILALYDLGQRDFGENYVQELLEKQQQLPKDIRWHFIGHLQTNKIKQIIGFVHLIHGADSLKLLKEINKQSQKINKVTNCLLQIYIAQEETKFGLDEAELNEIINQLTNEPMYNINVCGLMGMGSCTKDEIQVRKEFKYLKSLFDKFSQQSPVNRQLLTLSMGMTADYTIAIEKGSNMIRVGSLIFGERN